MSRVITYRKIRVIAVDKIYRRLTDLLLLSRVSGTASSDHPSSPSSAASCSVPNLHPRRPRLPYPPSPDEHQQTSCMRAKPSRPAQQPATHTYQQAFRRYYEETSKTKQNETYPRPPRPIAQHRCEPQTNVGPVQHIPHPLRQPLRLKILAASAKLAGRGAVSRPADALKPELNDEEGAESTK